MGRGQSNCGPEELIRQSSLRVARGAARATGRASVPTVAETPICRPAVRRFPTASRLLAVCALLLAVGLVFGQTSGFDFVNYDDDVGVYENRLVTGELTPRSLLAVFTDRHVESTVPLTQISTCTRVASFGARRRGPSLDQRVAARRFCGPAASGSSANDRASVAERVSRRHLRHSSTPRGIGGVGDGAEGRAERVAVHADVGGLPALRAATGFHSLAIWPCLLASS